MENENRKTRTSCRVAIAGAGPAGLLLAQKLAEKGISVAVFEAGDETSLGHDWSDAVEKDALASAGFELPEVVSGRWSGKTVKHSEQDDNLFEPHRIDPLEIRSPDLSCTVAGGVEFRYITTDRKALARRLVRRARDAGAELFFRHRAEMPLGDTEGSLEAIRVSGMRVSSVNGSGTFDVSADVTVDATGIASRLRRSLAGAPALSRKFAGPELAYACRRVCRLDPDKAPADDLADHYRYGAYRGYFWTHLHHDDSVDVGGGVREEPGRVDPEDIIDEMIRNRPSITQTVIRGGGGPVLVGRSPFSLVASGFVAVGDAAGQVIPTTGCGVGGAMTGALLAAGIIEAALKRGDFSIKALWPVNYVWFSGRGSHFAALCAVKDLLQALSHEEISFLMNKGIMNRRTLSPAINGVFDPPSAKESLRAAGAGILRPGLLLKIARANLLGAKIQRHYRTYPDRWDPAAFARWAETAGKLFPKVR